jgi:hypothetical protein
VALSFFLHRAGLCCIPTRHQQGMGLVYGLTRWSKTMLEPHNVPMHSSINRKCFESFARAECRSND